MYETTLSARGYGIEKNSVDYEALCKTLTVKPNNMMNTTDDQSFKVYQESSSKIYVPKHFGLKTFGLPTVNKLQDGEVVFEDAVFEGSLRECQQAPVASYLKHANDPLHMGGILQLPPGYGKTVMALYICFTLKTKTLVIVHKDFLLKQWK